jgi:predicted O-methyltransferase YrrM
LRLPWFSWAATDFLQTVLQPGLRIFEWGSGGSTLFFLEAGCIVTSAEHDPGWRDRVARAAAEAGLDDRLEMRLLTSPETEPRRYVESVLVGAPWDIVVVDGYECVEVSRRECVETARAALRGRGLLVLDDAYRAAYADVPSRLAAWKRRSFRGLGPARLGVTQTDVYTAPPGSPD